MKKMGVFILFNLISFTSGFKSLDEARQWVHKFADWYNHTHRHSQIGFVTPAQKHAGEDVRLMKNRKAIYEAAKQKNPSRWSGKTRKWEPITAVTLNPEKIEIIKQLCVA